VINASKTGNLAVMEDGGEANRGKVAMTYAGMIGQG
jgi:hypothetical protein